MSSVVASTTPRPVRPFQSYRLPSRIASAMQLLGLLGATAFLGGVITAGLVLGVVNLLSAAGPR